VPVTKSTKSEVVTSTIYTCSDGQVFHNESSANYHEWTLTATCVYTVTKRGGRSDSIDIFSTEELAQLGIETYEDYHKDRAIYQINKVYLDQRISTKS
jgi:hypothetical protein